MRRLSILLLLLALPFSCWSATTAYFTPKDSGEKVWVAALSCAHKQVLISCYGLTNAGISNALLDLKRHGVDVRICVDKLQSSGRSDRTKELARAGIEVTVKPSATLQHNKFAVIDNNTVLTGSWNLSGSADAQDNNLLQITDEPAISKAYTDAWKAIYARDGGRRSTVAKLYDSVTPPDQIDFGSQRHLTTQAEAFYLQRTSRKTSQQTKAQEAPAHLMRHIRDAIALDNDEKYWWWVFSQYFDAWDFGGQNWYEIYWPEAYALCATGRELLGLQPLRYWPFDHIEQPIPVHSFTPLPNALQVTWTHVDPTGYYADIALQPLPSIGCVPDWERHRRLAILPASASPATINGIPPGHYAFWLRALDSSDGNSSFYGDPVILTIPGA